MGQCPASACPAPPVHPAQVLLQGHPVLPQAHLHQTPDVKVLELAGLRCQLPVQRLQGLRLLLKSPLQHPAARRCRPSCHAPKCYISSHSTQPLRFYLNLPYLRPVRCSPF